MLPPCQALDFIEFFAGTARATQCMRSAGLNAAKFDYLYFADKKRSGNNYYDILTDAGFAYLDGGNILLKNFFDLIGVHVRKYISLMFEL